MNLPTTPTKPTAVNPRTLVIYGPPKVGKTTALAQLPNCLIVDLEDGTDYVEAMSVKVHTIQELRELASALLQKQPRYEFIAIDTVSKLEDWAEELATQNYKNSTIGKSFDGTSVLQLPKGAGYLWLRLAFAELVGLFSHCCGKGLILVGHIRDKDLDKPGIEVSAKDIDLTGKIRNIICSQADSVGYVYRKDNKMMISFVTSETVNCGSRCEHIKGKNMELDWTKIYI